MGSVPSELSLDFRPEFVPRTISNFLREVSSIGTGSDKASKLESFVNKLEEEMKKIDGFKRELPLCMLLLNDAILALKEESMQCVGRRVELVLEEFMPLKENNHSEEDSNKKNDNDFNCNKDKKNWMSSVQLWNTDDDYSKMNNGDPCKNRVNYRANLSFAAKKEEKNEIPVHGLSLLTPEIKDPKVESGCVESRTSSSRAVSCSSQANFRSMTNHHHHQQQQQQGGRKQRRCWSSELHRLFVNALHKLGGSQVATPKQIRELMQADGLTNDEVKSHLQKYRLHTRRLPPSTPANQSVVVVRSGPWMSQDQYGDSSKVSSSQSGSPQGPLQLATNTGGTSTTGGDCIEDDEDAKSEAYSRKSSFHKPGKDYV
ncbi:transcription factor HHO6-like [Hibiscus syriacus]|uniref:transcription factor HHO6-like n=1 Tax=Hibiscus syriacus TaxID=106335 RepID=UPI001923ABC2|nr:transcription factor HHO6-like [Hibiscus syriacus]